MVGDKVSVDGRHLGALAGFDETHMPNHMNIVVRTGSMDEPYIHVGDRVQFSV